MEACCLESPPQRTRPLSCDLKEGGVRRHLAPSTTPGLEVGWLLSFGDTPRTPAVPPAPPGHHALGSELHKHWLVESPTALRGTCTIITLVSQLKNAGLRQESPAPKTVVVPESGS